MEATKFTEVGFHGRDVDSIIKDLAELAVKRHRSNPSTNLPCFHFPYPPFHPPVLPSPLPTLHPSCASISPTHPSTLLCLHLPYPPFHPPVLASPLPTLPPSCASISPTHPSTLLCFLLLYPSLRLVSCIGKLEEELKRK